MRSNLGKGSFRVCYSKDVNYLEINIYIFFSRKVFGDSLRLQVHRDVARHQSQRGRAPRGHVGPDPAAASGSGGRAQQVQGRTQSHGSPREGLEDAEQQVKVLRESPRSVNKKKEKQIEQDVKKVEPCSSCDV